MGLNRLFRTPPGDTGATDKDLVLGFKAGGCHAYEEIYKRYAARVYAVCRKLLVNQQDVEEAVQETFLRVYQGLPRFNGRYELGAWMARIATNVCLDQLRASGRRPCDPVSMEVLDAEAPTSSEPETVALRRAEAKRLQVVLDGLPERHRAAIVLRDLEGFSYDEIGQILEMGPAQVKALIHRARKGFRRSWTTVASSFFGGLLPKRWRSISSNAKTQVVEIAHSSSVSLSSCSAVVQQCGQAMADRLAPIVTATIMGTAALSSGAVSPPAPVSPLSESTSAREAAGPKVDQRDAIAIRAKRDRTTTIGAASPETPADDASETPGPQPSAGTPTPTPAPSPSSSPSATPARTGSGGEATEPVLPVSPPLVAFDQGQAMQAHLPSSETVAVDCAAHSLSHSMTTMVGTKDGPVPAVLNLHVGTGAGFDLAVTKDGFKTRYIAGGTLLGRTRTPRYLILDVGGSFGTGDTYAAASGLPKNGSFSLHIVLDCSDNSVTSESLVLRGN